MGILGNPVNIWILGSSIIRDAFRAARSRPGGLNLGLERLNPNLNIWWQGYAGLRIQQVHSHIQKMLNLTENPPTILVLHVSGNNIGHTRIGNLRIQVKELILWLKDVLPGTTIVWSQILPRTSWRFSNNLKAMERCRYRLNNFIAYTVIANGGRYIHYPDLRLNIARFLKQDGVHLTDLGTEVLLNNLQGGLEQFLANDWITTFPSS